jgi:hypothetical protein
MFASSMAPLFVVFGLLDTFGGGARSIACYAVAALAVVSHAALFVLLARDRLGSATIERRYAISNLEERGADVMAYVATYLIPFAGFNASEPREAAALAIFLGAVGVLYVRSSLYAINPGLALIGFHLYRGDLEVSGGSTRPTSVLTRSSLPSGPVTVQAHQLGSDMLVAFSKDYVHGH